MLYVVATPIGNLGDLSARAIETLRKVELILAEDTRHFSKLAAHCGLITKVESFHEHNENRNSERVIERLVSGAEIALVSDAGTPLISDPGYRLIRLARERNIPVSPIPGPCAAIAALSVSGFEIERFQFDGFAPQKSGRRTTYLMEVLSRDIATVFYESPYRIAKTVAEIASIEPERQLFLARELTKIHEECLQLSAAELSANLNARAQVKGEIVLVVRPRRD